MGLILVGGPSGSAQGPDLRLCSPEWTRTTNPAINSRMLCQLSYGGPVARWRRGVRIPDREYERRHAGRQPVTGCQASSIEGVCIMQGKLTLAVGFVAGYVLGS